MSKSQFLTDEEIKSSIPFSTVNQQYLVIYPEDFGQEHMSWLRDRLAKSKIPGASDVNLATMRTRFLQNEAPGGPQDLECLFVSSNNRYIQLQVALWYKGAQDAVITDLVNFNMNRAGDKWSEE